MKAVFLDQQTFIDDIDLSAIEHQVTNLECFKTTSPNNVIERLQTADIAITNKVVLNEKTLKQLPNLKLICIAATGMNNVDLAAAKALGIAVMNVAGYAAPSVAQYVFSQLLNFYTNTEKHNQLVRTGTWQTHQTFCLHGPSFNELSGKTLGILGYGHLGQKVAAIAEAFDINVIIAERPQAKEVRTGRVSFESMLTQADIISLHCPQTPETEGLFDKAVFARMKPNSVLVNTARGPIVNNEDLLAALESKQIAGAILDVLEQEPPPADHILLTNQPNNLVITGHVAWASKQAQQRLINLLAGNINTFKSKHL